MRKTLFLSHIHEERELAMLLKDAFEEEFAGFVEVFVSSDGVSIPAGANFLRKIEDCLVECIGAIYLISPVSVRRNWINFELGAVWIRSAMSVRAGGLEIPALPMCHSGATPGSLPAPLNNLNAVEANQAARLEFAFRSIQTAVGGRGKLKTEFDDLAKRVRDFEHKYVFADNIVKVLQAVIAPNQVQELMRQIESLADEAVMIDVGILDEASTVMLEGLANEQLSGSILVERHGWGIGTTWKGVSGSGPRVVVKIRKEALLKCKGEIAKIA